VKDLVWQVGDFIILQLKHFDVGQSAKESRRQEFDFVVADFNRL
jgi:hypothetical protein